MKNTIKFDDFLLLLQNYILDTFKVLRSDFKDIDKINNIRLNLLQNVTDNVIIDHLNSLKVTKQAQFFLLENIKKIDINNNKSVTLEKISQIFNKINEIVNEYGQLTTGNIFFEQVLDSENIHLKKNDSVIMSIKNKKKCEENYKADSFNIVLDLDVHKTFEQYIHATSNIDTQVGQGKLLFNVNNQKNQHIYIIEKTIKNKYNGQLIDINDNKYRKLNLLPFVSIISKIVPLLSNLTAHENLVYFFRTPLIIMGDCDDVYFDYNKKMASFFTENIIDERQWFFSDYFPRAQAPEIRSKIIFFLKEYTIEMINLIKLNDIGNGIQNNEKIIVQQLYNLIKSLIFFDKVDGKVDFDYIEVTSAFLEKSEYYNNNYENLNLRTFDIINETPIEEIKGINDLKITFAKKIILEALKLRYTDENQNDYSASSFMKEISNEIIGEKSNIDLFFKKSENEDVQDLINIPEFKKILNNDFTKNLESNWDKLLNTFLFGFPNILRNENIHFESKIDKEYFYLLLYVFATCTEKIYFFNNFYLHLQKHGASGYENLCNLKEGTWQIYLLFEYFYPLNNLKWDNKKELKIKRIIHRYAFYHATEDMYEYYIAEKGIEYLEDLQNEIENYELSLSDISFFNNILDIKDKYNLSPNALSGFLKSYLSDHILLSFVDYLDSVKKDNNLKQSILWILSNKNFDDFLFIKVMA